MKIFTLLIIFAAFFVLAGCGNNVEKIVENPNSKAYEKPAVSPEELELDKIEVNPVKSRLTYSKFSEKYLPAGGKEIKVEKINFNEDGKRAEHFRYISNGDIDLQWLYDYDYYGRLISTETFDGYQRRLYKTEIEYNSDGTIEKIDEWTEKLKDFKFKKFFYNDERNLKEIRYYNPKGELESVEKYVYHSGNLDSLYRFSANDEYLLSIHFEYDSLGQRIKEIKHNKSDKTVTTDIKYDERGNILEIKNSILSSFKYEYDENDNLVLEEEFNSGGFLQSKFKYTYDESSGLVIQKIRYDGEDDEALIVRYEYEK